MDPLKSFKYQKHHKKGSKVWMPSSVHVLFLTCKLYFDHCDSREKDFK